MLAWWPSQVDRLPFAASCLPARHCVSSVRRPPSLEQHPLSRILVSLVSYSFMDAYSTPTPDSLPAVTYLVGME